VALLLGLGASFPAHAAEASEEALLQTVDRPFYAMEYEEAEKAVDAALKEPAGKKSARLHLYKGIILYHLQRKKEEGMEVFRQAFLIDIYALSPVQGLKASIAKDMETVREEVRRESLKPLPASPPPHVSSLRKHALIPTIAGGACAVAGGVFMAMSRGERNKLRNDDPLILSEEDSRVIASRGKKWQTLGVGLLGASAASLTAAAGMYLLGAPRSPNVTPSVQVGSTGSAVFIQGRWP